MPQIALDGIDVAVGQNELIIEFVEDDSACVGVVQFITTRAKKVLSAGRREVPLTTLPRGPKRVAQYSTPLHQPFFAFGERLPIEMHLGDLGPSRPMSGEDHAKAIHGLKCGKASGRLFIKPGSK